MIKPGRRLALWAGLAAVFLGSQAAAQTLTPGPPGPFVIDIRGATTALPTGSGLYPTLEEGTSVPARGFGGDVGAHVYPLRLGAARLGIGANVMFARGTSIDTDVTMLTIVPQVSFNFGSANGWSYLSAGVGTARVTADASVSVRSINAGGGARWFLNRHTAVGFDVRMHKLAAAADIMPASTLISVAVGLSVK